MFGVKALAGGFAHATPDPDVYLPLAHAAHRLPALISKPGLHGTKHAELACAPAGEIWPAGHLAQAPTLTKLPAAQHTGGVAKSGLRL